MGVCEFWFQDWFILRTCTLCEGGVLIRWFGPLGHCVGASDHATTLFVLGVVVSWVCILIQLYFVVVRHTLMMKHSLFMWL